MEIDNRYVINIISQEQQTKEQIIEWLRYYRITYSLRKNIYQSDTDYFGEQTCCYCNAKADRGLWNGYHRHICKTKHYRTNREPTSWFCQKCFNFALNYVDNARLLVYRTIKNFPLPEDMITIIIKKFIKNTKYCNSLYWGMIDL